MRIVGQGMGRAGGVGPHRARRAPLSGPPAPAASGACAVRLCVVKCFSCRPPSNPAWPPATASRRRPRLTRSRVRPDAPPVTALLWQAALLGLSGDALLRDGPVGPGLAIWVALVALAAALPDLERRPPSAEGSGRVARDGRHPHELPRLARRRGAAILRRRGRRGRARPRRHRAARHGAGHRRRAPARHDLGRTGDRAGHGARDRSARAARALHRPATRRRARRMRGPRCALSLIVASAPPRLRVAAAQCGPDLRESRLASRARLRDDRLARGADRASSRGSPADGPTARSSSRRRCAACARALYRSRSACSTSTAALGTLDRAVRRVRAHAARLVLRRRALPARDHRPHGRASMRDRDSSRWCGSSCSSCRCCSRRAPCSRRIVRSRGATRSLSLPDRRAARRDHRVRGAAHAAVRALLRAHDRAPDDARVHGMARLRAGPGSPRPSCAAEDACSSPAA